MKISSVSKKVLASALSAAMVVAFAPTVAFANIADGTPVTVNFDLNGGVIKDGSGLTTIPSASATVNSSTHMIVASVGSAATADYAALDPANTPADGNVIKKGEATFAGWYFDANADGKYTNGTDYDYDPTAGISAAQAALTGNVITLHARYSEPVLNAATDTAVEIFAVNSSTDAYGTPALTVDNLSSGGFFVATLASADGTFSVTSEPMKATGSADAFTFTALTADQKKLVKAGTYTMTVSKVGGGAVLTKDVKVVTVTLDAGVGYGTFLPGATTSHIVTEGTTYGSLGTLAEPQMAVGATLSFDDYVIPTGAKLSASGSVAIKSDVTLVAAYDNMQVSAAAIDTMTAGTSTTKGRLSFTVSNLTPSSATATYAKIKNYKVTVSGPNGFSKEITVAKASGTINGTLDFADTYEREASTTAKLAAGTYTVSAEAVLNTGAAWDANEKPVIASKSVTLAEVTYDLDGGSWIANADGTSQNAVKALPTLWQVGTAVDFDNDGGVDSDDFALLTAAKATSILKAPSALQSFKEWTINGKKTTDATLDLNVATTGVVVKAIWSENKIAAPEVSFTAEGTKFVMIVTPAAGTTASYSKNGVSYYPLPSDGKLTLDPSTVNSVWVMATTADKQKSSVPVQYDSSATSVGNVGTFASGVVNAETSTSTKTAPVRFGDTMKTAKADAEAAIKAIGYATAADWKKAEAAQELAMLKAAITIENANLQAAKTLTKAADGKTYSYLSDAAYEAAVANTAKVAEAFEANTDLDETGAYATKNDIKTVNNTAITTGAAPNVAQYMAALKAATDGAAKTTVAAADAEAATAVTAQLKAATTAEAAKAAIAAYGQLSNVAKELVSAADLAAAEAVIAAAAVKDAQDDAAVSKARNASKTVKAGKNGKTTKKQSVTLKAITSKSGAKVTYKKVSGKKAITVKSGKAYLAKGVKKGTYKATVKATCGTQTAKITVKFVVK